MSPDSAKQSNISQLSKYIESSSLEFNQWRYSPKLTNCKSGNDDLLTELKGKYRWKYHYYVESAYGTKVRPLEMKLEDCTRAKGNQISNNATQTFSAKNDERERPNTDKAYSKEVIQLANTANAMGCDLDGLSVDLILYLAEKQRWLNCSGVDYALTLKSMRNTEDFEWKIREERLLELYGIEQNFQHSRFLDKLNLREERACKVLQIRESNNSMRLEAIKIRNATKRRRLLANTRNSVFKSSETTNQTAGHKNRVDINELSSSKPTGCLQRFPSFPFGLSFLDDDKKATQLVAASTSISQTHEIPVNLLPSSNINSSYASISLVDTADQNVDVDILNSQAIVRSSLIKREYDNTVLKKTYLLNCLGEKVVDMSKIYDSEEDLDVIADSDNNSGIYSIEHDFLIKIEVEKEAILREKLVMALATAATSERLMMEADALSKKTASDRLGKEQQEMLKSEMKLYDEHSATFVQQCLLASSSHLVNQMVETSNLNKLNQLADILSERKDLSGTLLKNEIVSYLNSKYLEESIMQENNQIESFLTGNILSDSKSTLLPSKPLDNNEIYSKVESDILNNDV